MSNDEPASSPPPAATLGELRALGWRSRPVAAELRANAADRIASRQPLLDGVLGYEHSVVPQLENALLAGHDVIFLGERGQAKTRMIRSLVGLLDEWMPIVAGSEINDDPYAPVSRPAIDAVAEHGDDTEIEWVHRNGRYSEKLATPDTSIADLIGEVDPIKVAEGRYLSDELTLHYGLVPRTNRGIFAINELPDLSERIQVGLLNVLEERDVQIRGYKVRLPLDVVLVASANPEDYTNRGRIITPLKDRFGSQIRTHYPLDAELEHDIMVQEVARREHDVVAADALGEGPHDDGSAAATVPEYLSMVVAELSQHARSSRQVNQRSGVSVRLSVANLEALSANALRRGLAAGERQPVARVDDLDALAASSFGKIEFEALEDGREAQIFGQLVASAVMSVFRDRVDGSALEPVVEAFDDGVVVHTGESVTTAELLQIIDRIPALEAPVASLAGPDAGDGERAAAVAFVLEGLHLGQRLNKDVSGSMAAYRARY